MLYKLFAAVCDEGLCDDNPTGLPQVSANEGQITAILQIVFGVIGVVALVIIILAGLQLTVSAGDNPEAAKKARGTIVFAALGLIVAVSAELIVTFVLNKL